jgi:hypothetical protein
MVEFNEDTPTVGILDFSWHIPRYNFREAPVVPRVSMHTTRITLVPGFLSFLAVLFEVVLGIPTVPWGLSRNCFSSCGTAREVPTYLYFVLIAPEEGTGVVRFLCLTPSNLIRNPTQRPRNKFIMDTMQRHTLLLRAYLASYSGPSPIAMAGHNILS